MIDSSLSYADIRLLPNYSSAKSRSDIDTSVQFGPRTFKIPVLPANMKCTISKEWAEWMSREDYFYIMHRFGSGPKPKSASECATETLEFVRYANEHSWKTISISIGVQDTDKELLKAIVDEKLNVDYITIDIAHAHSIHMKEMLEFIVNLTFMSQRSNLLSNGARSWTSVPLRYDPFIIAGNVATPEAVLALDRWGADAIKIGIAQGGACTTYGTTGFGVPMFSCMNECNGVTAKPIIADGGIKLYGDISKAIVAGATMVMAGNFFVSSTDSPAETGFRTMKTGEVTVDYRLRDGRTVTDVLTEKRFKRYYGSASACNKLTKSHIEGTLVEVECDGTTYQEKFTKIEENLQSACSYAGGSMKDLRHNVRWAVAH